MPLYSPGKRNDSVAPHHGNDLKAKPDGAADTWSQPRGLSPRMTGLQEKAQQAPEGRQTNHRGPLTPDRLRNSPTIFATLSGWVRWTWWPPSTSAVSRSLMTAIRSITISNGNGQPCSARTARTGQLMAARNATGLVLGEAHAGSRLEPGIEGEAKALAGLFGAALDQHPGRRGVEIGIVEPRRNSLFEVREDPRRGPREPFLVGDRGHQLIRRLLRVGVPSGPLPRAARPSPPVQDRRREPATRSPPPWSVRASAEARPPQGIGGARNFRHPVDEVVIGGGGPVFRPAVAGQIEGHDVEPVEQRRESGKARRVIEPAVQRDDRPAVGRAPLEGRQPQKRQLEDELATAQRWSRYIRRANSPAADDLNSSIRPRSSCRAPRRGSAASEP